MEADTGQVAVAAGLEATVAGLRECQHHVQFLLPQLQIQEVGADQPALLSGIMLEVEGLASS